MCQKYIKITDPASSSPQYIPQILIEIGGGVFIVYFDLEYSQSIHPGHKAGQCGFTGTAHTDQQQVTLRLSEDTVDTQDVIQHLVEQDQRHIKLLFVENLEIAHSN